MGSSLTPGRRTIEDVRAQRIPPRDIHDVMTREEALFGRAYRGGTVPTSPRSISNDLLNQGVEFGATEASIQRLRGLGGRLVKWDEANRLRVAAVQLEIAQDVHREIRRELEQHSVSGYTISTLRMQHYGPFWTAITVGGAAGFLEFGTEPHSFGPLIARALVFPWQGEIVFAASVNHPGSPATHFMERAQERANVDARLRQISLYATVQRFQFQPPDLGMAEERL